MLRQISQATTDDRTAVFLYKARSVPPVLEKRGRVSTVPPRAVPLTLQSCSLIEAEIPHALQADASVPSASGRETA